MGNPVLVEVLRGRLVESRHRGAVAVADADGRPRARARRRRAAGLSALGNQGAAGAAADRERARPTASALATRNWRWPAPRIAASPAHVATATRMLARAGLDAVGAANAARTGRSTSRRRRRWRAPAAWRARCTTIAPASTPAFSAPPARSMPIAAATSSRRIRCSARSRPCWKVSAGATLGEDVCAVDGCSVPTWAMPLAALARAFARFGSGQGLGGRACQGGGAAARGLRRASLARRRHRALLHRDHAARSARACS